MKPALANLEKMLEGVDIIDIGATIQDDIDIAEDLLKCALEALQD